jgi:cytoskeletal protein CcmA (bactofilin family)
MSDLRMRSLEQVEIDTVLAEDIEFEGELAFEKPLMIKGSFKGKITSSDDLYIGEQAVVDAKIEASKVSIRGQVTGNVMARRRVELFSTSRFKGDIRTPDLVMESGCRFTGTCSMDEKEVVRNEKK